MGVVLGVVQGLTEFLPISSSGHLVVTQAAFGLRTPGVTVEVALHVATLLAVLIVYRARVADLAHGAWRGSRDALRYITLLVIGSVPAGVAGLAFATAVERAFESLPVVGVNFVLTGFVLWSTRPLARRGGTAEPTLSGAGGIGVAQAAALLPGISRSGATVAAALWLGVEPVRAAEFSFLLAVPAILGAAAVQVPNVGADMVAVGAGPLALSFASALLAGVLAIRLFVALLRHAAFHRFAPYCWLIGTATVLWALAR